MTLQLIGSPTSVLVTFILEAVNRILNIVFAFVPAMVGVDEAGTGLLANVLGFRHHRRHHVGDCSQRADVGLDWICCFSLRRKPNHTNTTVCEFGISKRPRQRGFGQFSMSSTRTI